MCNLGAQIEVKFMKRPSFQNQKGLFLPQIHVRYIKGFLQKQMY